MMGNDFLSQEELDALLGQVEALTDIEKDMVGEVGNIILGAGATALSNILGRKVDISTPEVEVKTLRELRNEIRGEKVCVTIHFEGSVEGLNALVLEKILAAEIADIMMGGVGQVENEELDEFKLSAVGEAMNQMMGSAATSLSDMIKEPVSITPPNTEIMNFDDENIKFPPIGNESDKVAKATFTMTIEGLKEARFFMAMPIPFVRKLYDMIFGATQQPEKSKQKVETQRQASAQAQTFAQPRREQPTVAARPVQFEDFGRAEEAEKPQVIDERLQLLFDVPLNVTVELGRTKLTLKEVMELGIGSLIELDKLTGEPVDIYVNNKLIARGEVVVIDENFGVRITEIVSPKERLYGLK
ncbi:MAG: flagellar motor switch phosphatase FliY [Fervidobacterium sp.]|uniref:Flagellar motor switch protein FliN/FliY n=1 Tax=Fervidobacterium gondwanense DSM 13020 TaxID=1121883 RepID=A0A1M7RVG8_FERGO|nr:flagellar motor switch phosphatase FliY [Fervidobacterium gondwanense]UXF01919.1 chemotaxis protein CheC [Fervidobacterium riparium]SHN50002.1 flagellar motor switch protein FliN/FliY [Fervidobacterium gondwanense DSM 13020]